MKITKPSLTTAASGFACLLLFLNLAALADEIWVKRYHGPGRFNRATAVAVDSAGNVAVTGFSDNTTDDLNNHGPDPGYPYYYPSGRVDYYTAKYAAGNGDLLWEQRYNGPGRGDDVATDVKIDTAGNVIVTGYSLGANGSEDFYTTKYATDGTMLWERRGPARNQFDIRLALDADGNVIVTGQTSGGPYFGGYYTAKYAALDGTPLWERRFTGANNQGTYTVGAPAVDGVGDVVVTGTAEIEDGVRYIYTEKYAAGDGQVIWAQRRRPGSVWNIGRAVSVDGDGNVVVSGDFSNGGPSGYYTAKYAAADGHPLWEKQFNQGSDSAGSPVMAIDSAGNVLVTAFTFDPVAGTFVVKYAAADGQQLWLQRYQDSCTPGADYSRAIAANNAGDVIVTGLGYDGDTQGLGHYHTVRFAATDGHVLWQANYIGPGNLNNGRDEVSALAVDGLGNVIVTGYSQTSTGDYFTGSFDYATVKYLPSGAASGTLTCPGNIVSSTSAGQCAAVVNFASPTATDECGNSLGVTCSPPSGSTFPKGTTTVNCTATDGSSCSFTVTVNDTEKPAIACPGNITAGCNPDLLTPVNFSATATDNCDPNPTITYSKSPGSGFPIGTTTVTCRATDSSGNQSSCNFTVTRAPLGFAGFLEPIGGADATGGSFADSLRTFKLKSTIPVKFSASCGGSPLLAGVHTLQATKWSSQTDSDPAIDATPTEAATTGNQFRLVGSEWHFNLDTKATGMSAGVWLLSATLSDGSQHSVWIQIK